MKSLYNLSHRPVLLKINNNIQRLRPLEFIIIAFYVCLIIANLFFFAKIQYAIPFILGDMALILILIYYSPMLAQPKNFYGRVIAYWYAVPLIFLTFKEVYFLIPSIRGMESYDSILITADRWLFGFDPTAVLFSISHPIITEILQIAYTSFYFLPMILGLSLYFQKKYLETEYVIFAVVLGFFISYFGYFIYPAVGPRFTLHDFAKLESELPGIIITSFVREMINIGESIPQGTINPILKVQRDVFPSGHTMMTLIVMYLGIRFNARVKWLLIILGSLLIFSTVYLRYHYVIDLIAGAVFMAFSIWLTKIIFRYQFKKQGRDISNLTV